MALNRSHVIRRLQKARDYLAQPGQWHCGSLYRVQDGKLVGACAVGALYAVDSRAKWNPGFAAFRGHNNDLIDLCEEVLSDTAQEMYDGRSIVSVNDDLADARKRDKRYVLRVYDRAIRNLQNAS